MAQHLMHEWKGPGDMAGKLTREQQTRTFERKPDVPTADAEVFEGRPDRQRPEQQVRIHEPRRRAADDAGVDEPGDAGEQPGDGVQHQQHPADAHAGEA
jgi:hypothetical protein